MKTALKVLIFLLLTGFALKAQPVYKDLRVDKLRAQLNITGSDLHRMNLLLQLSDTALIIADTQPSFVDSALLYAKQAFLLSQSVKEVNATGNCYLMLSRVYNEKKEFAQGRKFAEKAVDIFSRQQPGKKLAESYISLSNSYEAYGAGLTELICLTEQAANIYHNNNNRLEEATALGEWGEFMMCQGNIDGGIKKLMQCLAIYKSLDYKHTQDVYSLIGAGYTQVGNYPQGLKYGLQAVKIAEQLKDTSQAAASIYNYLSITYENLGQSKEAEDLLKKALVIAERVRNTELTIMLSTNIAHIALMLNKPQEAILYLNNLVQHYPPADNFLSRSQISSNFLYAYLQLKDYKHAAVACAELMGYSEKFPSDDQSQLIIYPFVCRYFLETGQYARSAKYLPVFKDMAERNGLIADLKMVHLLWYRLDSSQGNCLSAVAHYKLYKTFTDSLFNEAKSKQIAQLQIQYETSKKDDHIRFLTSQEKLHNKQLKTAARLRRVTSVGIVLLLIILILLYYNYRLKQASNKKMELQQEVINVKNKNLQLLVEEKEWLLKEIHHRVKNNFHTVMGLLGTQAGYLKNEEAIAAIEESQQRINAMSLIHQKLYQSDNLSAIDITDYINELVAYLKDSFDIGRQIQFNIQVQRIMLDISMAIPMGLILNEAITNSIKYAFPYQQDGIVTISLQCQQEDILLLSISDNGVGLPEEFDPECHTSMGMNLMRGLSKDLGGTLTIQRQQGTQINISFRYDPHSVSNVLSSNPS